MGRENKVFWISFAILLVGVIPGIWLWNLHFPNDLADQAWHTVLGIGAIFYFALMMPLMDLVRGMMREPESNPSPDDDIRLVGTSERVRWELMLKLLNIREDLNTPEQAAQLEALKRLLAGRR